MQQKKIWQGFAGVYKDADTESVVGLGGFKLNFGQGSAGVDEVAGAEIVVGKGGCGPNLGRAPPGLAKFPNKDRMF